MSDTKVNHTECCNLMFIGDNHSPYDTQKGIVVCRNCGTEYGRKEIKTLKSRIEKLQQISIDLSVDLNNKNKRIEKLEKENRELETDKAFLNGRLMIAKIRLGEKK